MPSVYSTVMFTHASFITAEQVEYRYCALCVQVLYRYCALCVQSREPVLDLFCTDETLMSEQASGTTLAMPILLDRCTHSMQDGVSLASPLLCTNILGKIVVASLPLAWRLVNTTRHAMQFP